ncbi:hypothetical protein Aph01nite_01960 [Acrocarpospora phusangensis]|uniref:Uncharacterized protein n=1 Tax=Acrocarpospora phusangensis TaxID=1070424 RepID=A0A919UHT1_9ACTN|nr:hypothetical protein [Acrocarpospora phusangensis]GIH21886.1 hypothetical protein Aph01nite_01960 [Acrocarpospora phusangensis]
MSRRRGLPFSSVVTALAGFILLWFTVPGIGPAVRAARADGVSGVFTARELVCVQHPGHESCTWTGDFLAASGTARERVSLYGSDRETMLAGATTPAVDIGRTYWVYGPGGSNEWVFTGLLLLLGAGLLGYSAFAARGVVRPSTPA